MMQSKDSTEFAVEVLAEALWSAARLSTQRSNVDWADHVASRPDDAENFRQNAREIIFRAGLIPKPAQLDLRLKKALTNR